MGRCKRKDNQQSHLQQIQQACADVEVGLRGLQGTLRSSNIWFVEARRHSSQWCFLDLTQVIPA